MTRTAEAGLIVAASVLAAIGIAIVEFTRGRWLDAQVVITLITFLAAFGGVHLAVRRWATGLWPDGSGVPQVVARRDAVSLAGRSVVEVRPRLDRFTAGQRHASHLAQVQTGLGGVEIAPLVLVEHLEHPTWV